MKKYAVQVRIPAQTIELEVFALSRNNARKTVLQQVTLGDLPKNSDNLVTMAVREADE